MKALVQRVEEASVLVDSKLISSINKGLLVFLGLEQNDEEKQLEYIIKKVLNLRIFENEKGFFDKSLLDVKGELLVVSQFTLLGDCKKGNRPSFTQSMPVEQARSFWSNKVEPFFLKSYPEKTFFGEFQAYMKVNLINDGPVTLWLES